MDWKRGEVKSRNGGLVEEFGMQCHFVRWEGPGAGVELWNLQPKFEMPSGHVRKAPGVDV